MHYIYIYMSYVDRDCKKWFASYIFSVIYPKYFNKYFSWGWGNGEAVEGLEMQAGGQISRTSIGEAVNWEPLDLTFCRLDKMMNSSFNERLSKYKVEGREGSEAKYLSHKLPKLNLDPYSSHKAGHCSSCVCNPSIILWGDGMWRQDNPRS